MTGHASEPADAHPLGRAAAALELQTSPDSCAERARLAAGLRRVAAGQATDADREVTEALAFLDCSSLGAPDVRERCATTDPRAVADVLDRLDAHDRRTRSGTERGPASVHVPAAGSAHPQIPARGPVAGWHRELRRLFRASTRSLPEVAEELARLGFHIPPHTLLDTPLLDDSTLVEAAVGILGGRWVEGGYRRLYLAARRAQPQLGRMAVTGARPRVSGLAGADAVDVDAVATQVAAPVHEVPTVRGRHRLIDRLSDGLHVPNRPVQVLVGDAGYGKSTVALAVAQRADADQVIALWVPAPDADALLEGLHLVAIRLGATASDLDAASHAERGNRVERLWRLLDASPRRWLLVLDDAGAEAVGHPDWLHRSMIGTVLVTSRFGDARGWGADAEVTEVGNLEPEHGGRVLLDCISASGSRVEAGMEGPARELSRRLAGMPLALLNAGSLVASGIGERTLDDLVEVVGPSPRSGPVGATYEICLHAISPSDQSTARSLLRLLACFGPDEPLPVSILYGYKLPANAAGVAPAWRAVLSDLVRVGLVEDLPIGRHTQRCVRIHPAVAEHSRRDPAFDMAGAGRLDRVAIGMLSRELDRLDAGAPANWPQLRRLEPHVGELVESPALLTDDLLAAALRLADRMSAALMRTGNHPIAGALLDRAVDRAAALGHEHPAQLDARQTRAWMMALDGDLARAEQLLTDLLVEKVRVLGPDAPSTLNTEGCLAWTMAEQGDLEPARLRFARVLASRTRVLGARHPDTLTTRHRLAWVTSLCGGESDGAAELATVLELRREALGSDHMDVYSTRYRLAWTLNKQGQHAEAAHQYRDLQADLEAVVGTSHPMTLMVRSRVACVLVWLNRFTEAAELYADLLVDQEKVLGVGHPRALHTQHLLACLKLHLGQVEQAERELRAVAAAREETLGPDHHFTMESRSSLAWALYQAGRAADADREFQAVLADRRRVLGERHPVTLLTRCLLARVLARRGRLADAKERLHRLLVDQMAVLPPDHRHVFDARHTLAHVQGLCGQLNDSERGLRAVLADRIRVLGADHRETLATRDYLSWVLGLRGQVPEALQVCEALLADRARLLGAAHPHTLTSRYRRAWLLGLDGRCTEALPLLEQLLVDLRQTLGDAHLDTLRCRAELVRMLRLCGELEDAQAAAQALVEDQERVQGADTLDTGAARDELELVLRARGEAGCHERGGAS